MEHLHSSPWCPKRYRSYAMQNTAFPNHPLSNSATNTLVANKWYFYFKCVTTNLACFCKVQIAKYINVNPVMPESLNSSTKQYFCNIFKYHNVILKYFVSKTVHAVFWKKKGGVGGGVLAYLLKDMQDFCQVHLENVVAVNTLIFYA